MALRVGKADFFALADELPRKVWKAASLFFS
jgi:hypothetical protein